VIATIDDLMEAGYSKAGAYKAKERGVMSDEKCEKLVEILGDRAREVLLTRLSYSQLGRGVMFRVKTLFITRG